MSGKARCSSTVVWVHSFGRGNGLSAGLNGSTRNNLLVAGGLTIRDYPLSSLLQLCLHVQLKFQKPLSLRQRPSNNTPNLPIGRLWIQQECTDMTQSGYFIDPWGFLHLYYVKSPSTCACPRQRKRQKQGPLIVFSIIFYQIHLKAISFLGNDKFMKTIALSQCICGGLAFCPQTL